MRNFEIKLKDKVLSLIINDDIKLDNIEDVEIEIFQFLEHVKFNKLVIDFTNIKYINSSGLAIFFKIAKTKFGLQKDYKNTVTIKCKSDSLIERIIDVFSDDYFTIIKE